MDGSNAGAERLGERLLGEVEVEGLSSLFASLRRIIEPDEERQYFGIPEIDALFPTPPPPPPATREQPQNQSHDADNSYGDGHGDDDNDLWNPSSSPSNRPDQAQPNQPYISNQVTIPPPLPPPLTPSIPILTIISSPSSHTPASSGKTSLLYLILSRALLPSSISLSIHRPQPPTTIPLYGQTRTILLFDPLSHLSIRHLSLTMTSEILTRILTHTHLTLPALSTTVPDLHTAVRSTVKQSLTHLHVFHTQTFPSLLSTLDAVPAYLANGQRHRSMARRVHSVVVEDLDAYVVGIRGTAGTVEDAGARLTRALVKAARELRCAVVVTSQSPSPLTSRTSSMGLLRLAIPLAWGSVARKGEGVEVREVRVAVRRVEVLRFKPGICGEEAMAEKAKRWDVVKRGRLEVWKVGGSGSGSGMDAGKGGGAGSGRDVESFVFRVGESGAAIEREEEQA
ncbi:hypothetical protein BU24DRAFT_456464 [Aaosphaeria arxii CBS 175.79]|uniref:DNA recombination and repair protein Rad51-like C-terminal domain-containing protein n=1 Tax=Aaosphaeria arxii CBS 175.79 TaxID=1450172 RepID=A0A6A5Y6E8_9PLEO|nr:uncharacterized protein BU24DRAFT_456464 [Aaosphaeria arxii CBS 175.79]KAF2020380.1 hypothetical protein BU24DRAFT_456464 [Aaosphaeria arxii CBS 175.79]